MTIEQSALKARVICNPASGGGGYDPEKIRAELEEFEVEWIETKESGDASEAAKEWDNGLLIVAGGDGTINEVVNGLGRAGSPGGVVLGILPAGTGNDLAATLAIPADPDEAEEVLRQNRVRLLDVARVRSTGIGEKFFINVATGGLGAEISDAADSEAKKRCPSPLPRMALATSCRRSPSCGSFGGRRGPAPPLSRQRRGLGIRDLLARHHA